MKILSVNAGSSSLKFTLFLMPEGKELIGGYFEKIGLDDSFYSIKMNGEKTKKIKSVKNHDDAVKILVEELIENKVIESLDELDGIGHRLVHGGEKYTDSVIINDEVIYAYIISLVLKRDYNIIKENFVYTNKVLFNEYMVKITITRHINLKKINTTNFKYLEINFVIDSYSNSLIDTKFFDNISIYYINIDIILKQIYSKSKIELNNFERFIILISTIRKEEMMDVINNKYLYYIYKKRMKMNTKNYEKSYVKDYRETIDFEFYKNEVIKDIKEKLKYYLDSETIEEVFDM